MVDLLALRVTTDTRLHSTNEDFIPMPPPIHCDPLLSTDDGVQCIYIIDKSSRIKTDLKSVNVTIEGNEWVINPPDTITKVSGGWLSFPSNYFASNQTSQNWNGLVQYAGMDDNGNTYIMQLVLDSSGGMIDYSFDYPQLMFDALPQQTTDISVTGFMLSDRKEI